MALSSSYAPTPPRTLDDEEFLSFPKKDLEVVDIMKMLKRWRPDWDGKADKFKKYLSNEGRALLVESRPAPYYSPFFQHLRIRKRTFGQGTIPFAIAKYQEFTVKSA